MKFIFLVVSLFVLKAAAEAPSKVIEIMTWDSEVDVFSRNDEESVKAHEKLKIAVEDSFNNGKRITESELAGFLKDLTEDDLFFFSPNKIAAFSIAMARFEGLLSKKSEKKVDFVAEEIKDMRLREVKSGEHSFFTPIDPTRYLDNSFRVLDFSLLLEAGSFQCPAREDYITQNKQSLPYRVTSICEPVLTNEGPDYTINTLLEALRKKDPRLVNRITTREVEACLEAYTFAVYFSTDPQIKLSAGNLIGRILHDLTSTTQSTKYNLYMVTNEAFLALMSALHRVILSKNLVQPLNTIYWTSLLFFDKSIRIEKITDDDQEKINLKVFGPSSQQLFEMTFSTTVFNYELTPFSLGSFDEFASLCHKTRDFTIDMRKMLFPSGFLSGFSSMGKFLVIGIIAMVGLSATLGVYVWMCKKKPEEDKKDIEFKEVKKNSDESMDDEEDRDLRQMSVVEEEEKDD